MLLHYNCRVPSPFDIPAGVINWVRNVFSAVNARSASTLSRIPNIYETTLDHALIAHLAEFGAPFRFPSEWIVNLDTHFLGGRYWGRWEIADIGILVVFRKKGEVLATKIALLQSKRLYPDEIGNPVDMHDIDYRVGFGRLLASESEYRSQVKPRIFHFSTQSKYRALGYQDEQYEAILQYTRDNGIPVHYLLYNPLDVPFTAPLPASTKQEPGQPDVVVGCRVMRADNLNTKLQAARLRAAASPSFGQLAGAPIDSGTFWTLHNFVADLVLGCKEGHLAGTDPMNDEGLYRVFSQRSGPISAAISITIDAPG